MIEGKWEGGIGTADHPAGAGIVWMMFQDDVGVFHSELLTSVRIQNVIRADHQNHYPLKKSKIYSFPSPINFVLSLQTEIPMILELFTNAFLMNIH